MTSSLATLIRDLHRRRGRERRQLAVAEGVRLVEEVLRSKTPVRGVVTSPALDTTARGAELKRVLIALAGKYEEVDDRALTELASTEHPQGVIVVIEPKVWTLDDIQLGKDSVTVVLDGVQDPGNVGTIVRTAFALGAAGVIALPGTVELTNPKVLRAGMGGGFRLPTVAASPEELEPWLARHSVGLVVTAPDGVRLPDAKLRGRLALVLGNEGAGVSPWAGSRAAHRLGIPIQPGAESLNVAVAAGILLYGVTRDR
ncbi:MAG: RNA methyltransferase [Gemmatimonadota bacterium]